MAHGNNSLDFPPGAALLPTSPIAPESNSPSSSIATAGASFYHDGFSHDPGYLASQQELRGKLFTIAHSAIPTRVGSPGQDENLNVDLSGFPAAIVSGSSAEVMMKVLSNRRRMEYLQNYVGEVAPWLDMFDMQCTFRIQLPALARDFPPLLYAILAISARQLERKKGKQDTFDSLQLYQEAIRLLSPLLQVRDPKVIAACTLLCCLEMMSAHARDWRRHLEGCAALFDAFGINGFSNGLLQAVFWCYARMDVCSALISDGTQSTLLEPSKWLAPGWGVDEARQLFREHRSPDMHANYAVYLCSRTCELVSDRTKFIELGEENGCTGNLFNSRWLQVWQELQDWLTERPKELHPVRTTDEKPFPRILFLHWAAISSNQLYHTACILLLDIIPKGVTIEQGPTASALWHARRVCGISLENPHQGCLNNAILPLWIAGRLFSHVSEHETIVNLIRTIEAATGWGARWRIKDLENAWGYKVAGPEAVVTT